MCIMTVHGRHQAALIAAVIFWGSSYIADSIALRSFSPLVLCSLRFLISSSVLFTYSRLSGKFRMPSHSDMKYIVITALTGISAYYYLENAAMNMTSASDASIISASYPLLTVLTGAVFFRVLPRKRQLAGIAVGTAGVLLLTYSRSQEAGSLTGNLILLFDGFLWALYNHFTEKISPACSAMTATTLQIIIGTLGFLPFLAISRPVFTVPSPASAAAALYLSLGCTIAALLLYNYGLRGTDSATAALYMNLMPVSGVILAALILHEHIGLKQMTAGLIILAGVLISERNSG